MKNQSPSIKPIRKLQGSKKSEQKKTAPTKTISLSDKDNLNEIIEIVTTKKYLRLRKSHLIGDVAEMILQGSADPQVAQFLIENDKENFGDVKKKTLHEQVRRFRIDLLDEITTAQHEANVSTSPITKTDYQLLRFKGRPMIALATMEKAVMVQENRIERAMAYEQNLKNNLVDSNIGQEVERWFRMAKEMATFKHAADIADDGRSAFAEMTQNFSKIDDFYNALQPEDKKKFMDDMKMLAQKKKMAKEAANTPKNDGKNDE